MAIITFDDQDINRMEQDLLEYINSFPDRLRRVQLAYYQKVRSLTPVDTGYMKSRWKMLPVRKEYLLREGNWVAEVENDTYYLLYVNNGHYTSNYNSYVPGQFFIEKARELTKEDFIQEMQP